MKRTVAVWCALTFLTAAPAWEGEAASQRPPRTDAESIRRLATRWLESYRTELSFVVADEDTLQHRPPGPRRLDERLDEVRTLRGELFLVYLETDRRWMAVHDVAEVDGLPVPDRESLPVLLARRTARSVFAELAERNARYNLGGISRNFNEPTLGLAILDPDRRGVRVERRRVATTPSGTVVTLGFKERERPTLVVSKGGTPVYAEGEIDVDAATGAVLKTVLRLEHGAIDAALETVFTRHDTLGLYVPVTFTERYEDRSETIVCETRYSNFRRFQTSGRLVGAPDAN
jgi:hypothetical protein